MFSAAADTYSSQNRTGLATHCCLLLEKVPGAVITKSPSFWVSVSLQEFNPLSWYCISCRTLASSIFCLGKLQHKSQNHRGQPMAVFCTGAASHSPQKPPSAAKGRAPTAACVWQSITKHPKLERTHKDHWVLLPAPHSTAHKSEHMAEGAVQTLPELWQLGAMPTALW